MDPLHAWKDDFSREVEEVLASRARSQERGEAAPVEGFGGRLADLVIPPAGTYAELRDALKNLELARVEVREMQERLAVKEVQFEREREGRERMKDGAARLAFMLRDERATRAAGQAEVQKARQDAAVTMALLETARLDAEHGAARVEDWEREAMARLRAARELQARFDRVMLDSDAKDAEAASLRARLDAAARRAQAAEVECAASRADAASRESLASRLEFERVEAQRAAQAAAGHTARAEASERTALTRLAAYEAELRSMSANSASFEREAQRLVSEISQARDDAAGAHAREHASGLALSAERATLRAEFEETRAKLEGEMDAERRALRERWKEQTEALDRLRKDLGNGRPGA